MRNQLPRTSWVFDRPLLRDGLFWFGLMWGLVQAFFTTSSVPFAELSLVGQVVDLVWRVLVAVLTVGVVGGTVRNFVRGYRGTGAPATTRTTGAGT